MAGLGMAGDGGCAGHTGAKLGQNFKQRTQAPWRSLPPSSQQGRTSRSVPFLHLPAHVTPTGAATNMIAATLVLKSLAAAPSWRDTPGSVSITRSSVVSPHHCTCVNLRVPGGHLCPCCNNMSQTTPLGLSKCSFTLGT